MSEDDNIEEEDLRSPRERASKIPSWIMVGFILGALTFYTVSDYFARPKKEQPAEEMPGTPGTGSATSGAPISDSVKPADDATVDDASLDAATTKVATAPEDARFMSLLVMDAIFREWAVNAMWEYNTTQVVFWNPSDGEYSVAVEVFRVGAGTPNVDCYYRIIDRVSRPIIRDPARPGAPLLFTESEEATKRRKEKENERWW